MKQPTLCPGTRGRRGVFRGFSAACRLAAVLAVFALAQDVFAQTAAPAPLSSNRFLFVVDISKPMEKHIPEIVGVVNDILRSSASGQLHDGDSIGVWTFNEDVHTGNLPLQTWSADDGEEITLRIGEFLRQQDYGKKSRLDFAMGAIDKVIRGSDIITVFIISSGAGPIHGTPFDDDINVQYLQCLRDMGRKPKPLVTVLQGNRGRMIRYTVTAVPWPVVIPELPIPLKITQEPPARPVAAPVQRGPSMILVGPDATATPTPAPAPVQPAPISPAPAASILPQTAAAPQPPPQAPAFSPPQSPAIRPPPAASPQIPTPAAPVLASTPQNPPAEVVKTPSAAPPVTAVPASVFETPSPVPPPPNAVVRPPTSAQLPLVQPRPPPLVQKPLPASETMAQDTASAAPALSPPPAPATPKPVPASGPAAPAPVAPPPNTLTAQAVALIKSFTGNHRNLLLAGGACLLVAVAGLIFMLARGSRPSGRSSLISQTMNDRRQ